MLVLTRKLNESIVIGKDIKITVVKIRGDHVRIGIEAPREVEVYRSELVDVDFDAQATDVDTGHQLKTVAGISA